MQALEAMIKTENIRVLVGECRRAHVVDPFQYYAEPGERIAAVQALSHTEVAQAYAHYDRSWGALAQLDADGLLNDFDPVNGHIVQEDELFDHLLREMHLASVQSNLLWDPKLVRAVRGAMDASPIVIGGCGRSGTTLLLSILGAHPAIFAFPEEMFPFFPYPFRLQKLLLELEKAEVKGCKRWAEKTPKNVRAFGSILAAFGQDVHLIHIVRDGRDVVTSHHPNHKQQFWVSPERWVADVWAGLEYKDRSLLVRYEDLLQEPVKTLSRICDYLGEPFDERMLRPEEHSTVRTNVAWEGASLKALHQNAIGRWKASEYSDRVDEFMKYPGANDLIIQLGYK